MNKPNNKRSRDTDEAIIRAAFEVLVDGKKPVSKITVREICEAAGINRSTFYAHYLDVYDLFDRVEKRMAEMSSEVIIGSLTQGGFRAGIEAVLRFILEYREFYQLYFTQFNRLGHLMGLMTEPFQEQIQQLKARDLGHGVPREVEYHYDIFTAAMGAILYRWLKNDCREDPSQLCQILERAFGPQSLVNTWMSALPPQAKTRE